MVTTIITAMAAYSNERVAAIILSVLYRMLTIISISISHMSSTIQIICIILALYISLYICLI